MLNVNDRVSRSTTIGSKERRWGTVVEVYHGLSSTYSPPYKMYAVRWDDTSRTERGYLEHGLQKEEQS